MCLTTESNNDGVEQLSKTNSQNRQLEREVHDLMLQCQEKRERDVEDKQEELEEQKQQATKADKRRLEFVEDEARNAQEHGKSMTEDVLYATRKQRLGQSYLNNTSQSSAWNTLQTSTDPESSVSLERSSRTFDKQELALLNEVRRLRQKLAIENRNKKPPVNYDST